MCLFRSGQGSQERDAAAGSSADDEQPGPSRRKRQPSMSESMPLYTLCKEDLDSMDKEVKHTYIRYLSYLKTSIVFINC